MLEKKGVHFHEWDEPLGPKESVKLLWSLGIGEVGLVVGCSSDDVREVIVLNWS
jgi:hypothetical protein